VTGDAELRGAVEAWVADDPDPGDRAELQVLLDRAFPAGGATRGAEADAGGAAGGAEADAAGAPAGAEAGAGAGAATEVGAKAGTGEASAVAGAGADADALDELRDRFSDRLHFGTAGLRGVVAAGPNRMNRAVVRAATAAVAGWLAGSGVAAVRRSMPVRPGLG
jgi:phosphomannomutase